MIIQFVLVCFTNSLIEIIQVKKYKIIRIKYETSNNLKDIYI